MEQVTARQWCLSALLSFDKATLTKKTFLQSKNVGMAQIGQKQEGMSCGEVRALGGLL